jgi:hypothetical protein
MLDNTMLGGRFIPSYSVIQHDRCKGGLTPRQQLATCSTQHFLVPNVAGHYQKMLRATCC